MAPPDRIRIVLFDMDGVLVDVSRSYRRAIEETAAAFLGHPPESGVVQRYKNRGGFNDDWRLTEAIIRDAGGRAPFDDIVRVFDGLYRGTDWDGYIASEPALVSDTLLERLVTRFGGVGLVTGRPRAEAEWTLRRFGWDRHFRVVVALEDQDGRSKPDPYPLEVALRRFSISGIDASADEAVYVGDSVDDMMAADRAGMIGLGFVPPYLAHSDLAVRLAAAGARTVIASHDHLERAIERMNAGATP